MFGFGKPKAPEEPFLFSLEVQCDGQNYDSWKKKGALRSALLRKVKPGAVVQFEEFNFEGKPVFAVENKKGQDICCVPAPLSGYLVKMIDGLTLYGNLLFQNPPMITMNVYGRYKEDFTVYDGTPGERKKEYTYNLDNPDQEYFMLPYDQELECTLVEYELGFKVMYGKALLALITDDRKVRLADMLHKHHCITTVRNVIKGYYSDLKMTLRF